MVFSYRVRQSHYYLEQFWDAVDDLRIEGRIEGYQTYQEFVRRRLGGTFRFIQGVGERFTRVQQTVAGINEQLHTVQELQTQEKIREIQVDGAKLIIPPFAYYLSAYTLKYFDKYPEVLHKRPWIEFGILVGSLISGIGLVYYRTLKDVFKRSAQQITRKTKACGRHIRYRIYVYRSKLRRMRQRGLDKIKAFPNKVLNARSVNEGSLQMAAKPAYV